MESRISDKIKEILKEKGSINTGLQHEYSRLTIEKLLPYICVYRFSKSPEPLFEEIVRTQASYLVCRKEERYQDVLTLISEIVGAKLGTMMVLELWPGHANSKTFKLYCSDLAATITAFKEAFETFSSEHSGKFETNDEIGHPPGLKPLFTKPELQNQNFTLAGLEIPPMYRGAGTTAYPIYFRGFKSFLSDTIKKSVFAFIRMQTPKKFSHHTMLGKTVIDEATRVVDQCLSEVSQKLEFLLMVTPVNQEHAWQQFKRDKFNKTPQFKYRMIDLDPEKEKNTIYSVPMDKVEDPALSFVLRDKRRELSKQLSMLEERGTNNFRYIGQSIYGTPSDKLVKTAKHILKNIPGARPSPKRIDCHGFLGQVKKALPYYSRQFKKQKITATIHEDVTGLIVSQRHLMIGASLDIASDRAQALIQHEIGTHVLTYCNGYRQPLRLMASGFASYDQLQEGMGVLSEYLAGGFEANRLRLLAARVLAVNALVNGSDFISTFNLLTGKCKLKEYNAFKVATRVFRSGGLTKDAIYLEGLIQLLDFIREGGNLKILYTGKFNFKHIPLIEELLNRDIVKSPVLPHHFTGPETQKRLAELHRINDIEELLNNEK